MGANTYNTLKPERLNTTISNVWTQIAAGLSYNMMIDNTNKVYQMGLPPANYAAGTTGFVNRLTAPTTITESGSMIATGPNNAGYTTT